MDTTQNQIAVVEQQAMLAPLNITDIDLLDSAVSLPMDLMSDYLTPETIGQEWNVIFDGIDITTVPDQVTGEAMELECAFFYHKDNGQVKRIRNASKRLVGALSRLPKGTPLKLKYLGKKRNKLNSHMADHWAVNPLVINVTKPV